MNTYNKSYTLVYWQENGRYVGKLRDIPMIHGLADNIEDLEAVIKLSYQQSLTEIPQPLSLKDVQTRSIKLTPR